MFKMRVLQCDEWTEIDVFCMSKNVIFWVAKKIQRTAQPTLLGDLSIHAFQPYVSNHQEVSLDANMRCGIF